ncbi:MAG: hypothetical protein COB67_02315 [SAR324 cluster bacterium]|uniref:Uncharacterized protein n=1 Tax=SAR324 cluster bacterium TaxID=2024889 RepID=A0A2A4T9Z3_9DELT|nr:MAG: hypothetical protein COB67_02315 [SAR324 cluster bacterium]
MILDYKYNKETKLLGYSFEMDEGIASSCFAVSIEAVQKICPALLDGTTHKYVEETYTKLHEAFFSERYKVYKGITVSKTAKREHLQLVHQAYKNCQKLMVEYEEGYEMYPSEEDDNNASYSDNGLVHIFSIGKSTGVKPIFLQLASSSSFGGSEFMFTGVKKISLVA